MEEERTSAKRKSFVDTLQSKLSPIAEKVGSIGFLTAISRSMQTLIPVLIIGSFAVLFANAAIGNWKAIAASTGIAAVCNIISSFTIGGLGVYVVILASYYYAELLGVDKVSSSIISLASFLILTPLTAKGDGLVLQWLGAPGLFVALLVAYCVVRINQQLVQHNVRIRMPEGVPAAVSNAFTALIPGAIILTVMGIISQLLAHTSAKSVFDAMYVVIQTPLTKIGTSFAAFLLIQILATLVFYFGIHANTVLAVVYPVLLAANAENLAAYTAGQVVPHIINFSFLTMCQPGGVGGTLGLALAMLFLAKSQRYKTLGRIAIFPAIFNINEPLIFGTPIMLNPILFIPFMLTPIVCTTLSYVATATGLIGRMTGVIVDWSMPMVASGFLAGGIGDALMQVVLIAVSCAIWFPFFRLLDRQALEEEASNTKTGAAEA